MRTDLVMITHPVTGGWAQVRPDAVEGLAELGWRPDPDFTPQARNPVLTPESDFHPIGAGGKDDPAPASELQAAVSNYITGLTAAAHATTEFTDSATAAVDGGDSGESTSSDPIHDDNGPGEHPADHEGN